jgi:AraC-like DNA-binding protein
MTAENNLQKLTDTETQVNEVLALEQITPSDIDKLDSATSSHLLKLLNEKLNTLKGTDLDMLCKKIEPILSQTTKNQLWESNHVQITQAVSNLLNKYGRMPTKAEIAQETELSRQTIHKHFKEYAAHPLYLGELEQFRFMTSKLLATVYSFALRGDTGAAKLFFNVMGYLNNGQAPNGTTIQNQNNFIQINGTKLSQEAIKNLNPEQLSSIESILKTILPSQPLH